jgi:hypothetical protein
MTQFTDEHETFETFSLRIAVWRRPVDAVGGRLIAPYLRSAPASMQAIGATAPDLPPKPGVHAAFARDHEYKRHATLSLLAGTDLATGKAHALVKDRHCSCEFIEFWHSSMLPIRLQPRSRLSSTTIPPTLRRKPKPGASCALHRKNQKASTSIDWKEQRCFLGFSA